MKGALFFSGKYGSTEQYAQWIQEETGLPVFDIKNKKAEPKEYDFLVLGSSVMYYKLTIRKWVQKHAESLKNKPIILFSVSGAGPGKKLDDWVANSLPGSLKSKITHIGLRGRMDHSKLGWFLRMLLHTAALFNPDPQASKEEREGFDYMDKTTIEPIVKLVAETNMVTKEEV